MLHEPSLPSDSVQLASPCRLVSFASSKCSAQPANQVEALAQLALQRRDFSEDSLVEILQLALPRSQANPRPSVLGDADQAAYFIVGHFCSKTGEGLTNHCHKFPSLARLLNAFFLSRCPDGSWGSFAVAHNAGANPHRDAANCPSSLNYSVSIGNFKGGGLLVESDRGAEELLDPASGILVRAELLNSAHRLVSFSPQLLHASAPWTGDKWSLTAYSLRSLASVGETLARDLAALDFPLSVTAAKPPEAAGSSHRAISLSASLDPPSKAIAEAVPQRVVRSISGVRQVAHTDWPRLHVPLTTWSLPEALPRLPLIARSKGPVLLLSLFDGIGCAAITLAALGLQFVLVAIEIELALSQACQSCFTHAFHFADVRDFHVGQLPAALRKSPFWMILVVGGSPCQGNSVLNRSRQGMGDPRTRLFQHVKRVFNECKSAWPSSVCLAILENVQGAPKCFRDAASHDFPVAPFLTNAKDFGYVARPRAWWACLSTPLPALQNIPSVSCVPASDGLQLSWEGKRCPKQVVYDAGFQKGSSEPFPCFTRCFWHPCDRLSACDSETRDRFFEDGRRFPPHTYKSDALLWKGSAWRVPSVREKASMHCIPAAALKAVHSHEDDVAARHSALGNSFHVPSFAMVLCVLLAGIAHSTALRPGNELRDPAEAFIAARLEGTVFYPGFCQSFPGCVTADSAADSFYRICRSQGFSFSQDPSRLAASLRSVNLAALQCYWIDLALQGSFSTELGPDFAQQRAPARASVATGQQRGTGLSKWSLPPLHPSGLSKDEHILQSSLLDSPFHAVAPLDRDLSFAARAVGLLGPCVANWRSQQVRILQALSVKLRPWDLQLARYMPASVKAVAEQKRPGFMLVCALILRWPDPVNALRFVTGYKVVGDIECSGLFRPIEVDDLGPPAMENLEAMKKRVGPGPYDSELKQCCMEEVQLGHAIGPFSEIQMNERFGQGGWRPLERFMLLQSDKYRPIDSGKKPGHNSAALERETIFTASVDSFLPFIQAVMALLAPLERFFPGISHFLIGTEDMKHAYRQCPVHPDHLCVTCAAFWDHELQQHQFIILQGLPFGLSSAVLCFNRTPAFLSALCRRVAAAPVLQFFDDSGICDLAAAKGSAQAAVRACFKFSGNELDSNKSQPPADCRVYLGLSVNLGVACSAGCLSFDLKPGFRDALKDEIQAVLREGKLSSGRASKLRGKFGWAATGTFGRCGRVGLAPLVTRQFSDESEDLTNALSDCLRFHLHLAEFVPPRLVPIAPSGSRPTRVYSDASFEPSAAVPARIGFVCFPADGSQPVGMSVDVPDLVLGGFQVRQTQINACETLAGVIVPTNAAALLRGQDVIWYVDNQTACQILMKGSSSVADLCVLSAITQLLLTRLGCRVYYEYIESDANPSDGLSRDGLDDEWTQKQRWQLSTACMPPILFQAFESLSGALLLV